MRYLSVCSGIEAATVAWHPLGWEAAAYSEIEKFPSQVLEHHYPNTPNVGDMTKFKEWTNVSDVDVLVGGTPCQSFSVAGLRKGLDDPRGNLMLTYLAIAAKYRPKWLVWENVPGVLSSNGGLDFASLLRGMGELGYGFAYRVLDAQYFGVAQRRRRVFVVGYAGNWRPAAAVLFERHSMCGYPAPSREKGQGATRSARTSLEASGTDSEICGTLYKGSPGKDAGGTGLIAWPAEVAPTIDAHFGDKQGLENQHINGGGGCLPLVSKCLITKTRMDAETETLIPTTGGHFSYEPIALAENIIGRKPENGGNHDGFTENGPMYTLNATGVHGVAQPIPLNSMNCFRSPDADASTGCGIGEEGEAMFTITKTNSHAVAQPIAFSGNMSNPHTDVDIMQTLQAQNPMAVAFEENFHAIREVDVAPAMTTEGYRVSQNAGGLGLRTAMQVRRLTPVECERLQGFPDGYTDIKLKGKPTPDGPRYKALGNSMAVPVMAWIGKRIQEVESLLPQGLESTSQRKTPDSVNCQG